MATKDVTNASVQPLDSDELVKLLHETREMVPSCAEHARDGQQRSDEEIAGAWAGPLTNCLRIAQTLRTYEAIHKFAADHGVEADPRGCQMVPLYKVCVPDQLRRDLKTTITNNAETVCAAFELKVEWSEFQKWLYEPQQFEGNNHTVIGLSKGKAAYRALPTNRQRKENANKIRDELLKAAVLEFVREHSKQPEGVISDLKAKLEPDKLYVAAIVQNSSTKTALVLSVNAHDKPSRGLAQHLISLGLMADPMKQSDADARALAKLDREIEHRRKKKVIVEARLRRPQAKEASPVPLAQVAFHAYRNTRERPELA